MMIGDITSAAAGSAHHHPTSQFDANPIRSITDRYAQKSVCRESAFIAALPSSAATPRFARDNNGMAIKEAPATAIPIGLCSGPLLESMVLIDSVTT
jgi:hypothetical protein